MLRLWENSTCTAVRALHVMADTPRCDFEKNLPFNFRCRAAMQAVPSSWPDPAVAVRESPEPSKKQMRIVFQVRTCLRINSSLTGVPALYTSGQHLRDAAVPAQAVLRFSNTRVLVRPNPIGTRTVLPGHRREVQRVSSPNFASVEYESNRRADAVPGNYPGRVQPVQPVPSRGNSALVFLGEWDHFPPNKRALLTMRVHDQYHVFNSAVCVGTLVLHNPQNVLAAFAVSQIETAIALFSSAVQMHASPRAVGNLQWLLRLRSRALSKMHAAPNGGGDAGRAMDPEQSDSDEDVELLGWRTRLIERAAAGAQTAKTIESEQGTHSRSNLVPPSSAPYTNVLQQSSNVDFSEIFGIPTTNSHASADTDTLVR